MDEVKRFFRPEFLNRIDGTVVFHALSKEHILDIVDLMIKQVRENLYEQRLSRDTSFASKLSDLLKTATITNLEQVEALLNEDASLARGKGPASGAAWLWGQHDWTPLHRATMQLLPSAEEQHRLIDLLLANGADVNATLGNSGSRSAGSRASGHAVALAGGITLA